ncbi:MAG: flagellar hook basal-body protein [Terracidiphilus sp.]|nr:flagellar hook basal-body protein [Terracidiphilus sp.]
MDSGYYAAMTGLVARTQALDLVASNLANAQTPGYRAEREFFRSVLLGPGAADSQLGRTVNDYGLVGGDRLNLVQGTIQQTGNSLDVAIEGEGFFVIQTANGLRYTRDGSFRRATDGRLVTARGEAVLSSTNQLIQIPPGEVSIGAGGDLSVAGGTVARLAVVTFPQDTQLKAEGADRYVAPQGTVASASKNASVRQGALEGANQDTIQGTLDLIVMQRQAEMMQKALTVFHTDFNKFATEDLPRV